MSVQPTLLQHGKTIGRSQAGSTPANNTVEILLNKKPQHQPQQLTGSRRSDLAAPCEQGWDGGGVVGGVVRNDTTASSNGTVEKISTQTAISSRKLSTCFMIKAMSGLLTPPAVSTSLRTSATSS